MPNTGLLVFRRKLVAAAVLLGVSQQIGAALRAGPTLVPAGDTSTRLPFDVEPAVDGSYFNLQFDLLPALRAARLIRPSGETIELLASGLLRRIKASERQHSEQGDEYILRREIREPEAGRWTLILEHSALGRPHDLVWSISQQPRFKLVLQVVGGSRRTVGVEFVALLKALDYGRVQSVREPALQIAGPGGSEVKLEMKEARSEPGALSGEDGVYVARFSPRAPGRYVLVARARFSRTDGTPVAVVADIKLDIEAARPGQGNPVEMFIVGMEKGCWTSVSFELPWRAEEAGIYTFSLELGNRNGLVRVAGSTEVAAPGPVRLRAVLESREAAKLTSPRVDKADRLDVIYTGSKSELLRRERDVELPRAFDVTRRCN